MFHLLNYRRLTTTADSLTDMTATTDPIFSQRNGHFIFSEEYKVLWMSAMSVTGTIFRMNMPSINAVSRHHVFPLNAAALPPSYPRIEDLRSVDFRLPLNEEMAFEVTDTVAEEATVNVCIAPLNWNRNLPPADVNLRRLLLRFTVTVTRIAAAWSGPTAITFEQTPRGGWYCVNACYLQSAASRAFRLFFPRAVESYGRILRPGMLCTGALGNLVYPDIAFTLGEWGRFHTFEPPQIETYADAAGADACIGFMDVTYLGQAPTY